MHMGNPIYQLTPGQDHRRTPKNITTEIQDHEYNVSNLAVAHTDDLKGRMGVWDANFGHHAQGRHESDLEAEASCPPLFTRQS